MAASANYIRNLRSSVAASVGPVVGYGEPLRPLTLHAPPPATAGQVDRKRHSDLSGWRSSMNRCSIRRSDRSMLDFMSGREYQREAILCDQPNH